MQGPDNSAGTRTLRTGERQKSRIGSMMSAKISTAPEIKIIPPTTYAIGNSLAVST